MGEDTQILAKRGCGRDHRTASPQNTVRRDKDAPQGLYVASVECLSGLITHL